jgi:hypothetical protein
MKSAKNNNQDGKLKRHIDQRNAFAIIPSLDTTFGLSLDTINRAMKGDVNAAHQLGELAKEGRIASEFSDLVKQAVIQTIEGTAAQTQAQAEIMIATANAAQQINNNIADVAFANQKFSNTSAELNVKQAQRLQAETVRHKHTLITSELRAYIDAHLSNTNNQTQLEQINERPRLAQHNADISYNKAYAKEALASGDTVKLETIAQPQYTGSRFYEGFVKIKSALGF